MAYTAKNIQIFTAAYAGALAGMGVSDRVITDTNAANYAGVAAVAGAFSQAVDTAWGDVRSTSLLDVEAMQCISEAYWQNRAPQATPTNLNVASYAVAALAIIALITAGEGYFSAEGLTPPPIPSGSGGSLSFIALTCSSDLTIAQYDPIPFDPAYSSNGTDLSYDALNYEVEVATTGRYLINYTIRVVVSASAPQVTWGLVINGNSMGDPGKSCVDFSGLAAGSVVTISQSFVVPITGGNVVSLSQNRGDNDGEIKTGGDFVPSASLTMTLLAAGLY